MKLLLLLLFVSNIISPRLVFIIIRKLHSFILYNGNRWPAGWRVGVVWRVGQCSRIGVGVGVSVPAVGVMPGHLLLCRCVGENSRGGVLCAMCAPPSPPGLRGQIHGEG